MRFLFPHKMAKSQKDYFGEYYFFDLGYGKDYVYHGTTKFEGLHHHDILQLTAKQQKLFKRNDISKLYPEYYIIKVNQFDGISRNALDEWIYFLKQKK